MKSKYNPEKKRLYYLKNREIILKKQSEKSAKQLTGKPQQMVLHHTKYKEIHGVDETILMTKSEHLRLHRRLRKEGKCNIPPEILVRISDKAIKRTIPSKTYRKNYTNKYIFEFAFLETLYPNIQYYERIRYNKKLGTLTIRSGFAQFRGKRLYYIYE